MLLLREPKTPKWLDASVAITLLLLAALFLGMIQAIFNKLPSTAFEQRDLKSEYQVALYIIPFFTAGIATNLISSIILNQRDYSNSIPLKEAINRTIWFAWIMLLTLSIGGLLIYAIYKKSRKHHPHNTARK